MAWYDDPNNTQGPSAPGGAAVPPSQTPGPGQPPPASGHPQMPAGPPQMPGGPPPVGPPPGVHGDLPTSGGGNNNRTLLIIAGLAVAVVITLAGGIGALMLLSGPEELSLSDYADKMCEETLKPSFEDFDDLTDSRRYERVVVEADINDEDEAKEAIGFLNQNLDRNEDLSSAIGSFNSDHIVRGRVGEDLQEELSDYVDDFTANTDKLRDTLNEADPSDEEDVLEDFHKTYGKLVTPTIYREYGDPGYDLVQKLNEVDDDCGSYFTSF